jgi:hypothetical protein
VLPPSSSAFLRLPTVLTCLNPGFPRQKIHLFPNMARPIHFDSCVSAQIVFLQSPVFASISAGFSFSTQHLSTFFLRHDSGSALLYLIQSIILVLEHDNCFIQLVWSQRKDFPRSLLDSFHQTETKSGQDGRVQSP